MNISEAQRNAYAKLERKCEQLEKQRDRLKVALEKIESMHESLASDMKGIARAALKEVTHE